MIAASVKVPFKDDVDRSKKSKKNQVHPSERYFKNSFCFVNCLSIHS